MPSPSDFNLSPYFDDFTESKKFHRILFRPAFAVQARELTQSQTILQNQVERLSDHFFDKGAMVIPGEIGYDLEYYAVKLTSKSASDITSYVGSTLTGTSGVTAKCINAVVTDGTDPDTLFVKYLNNDTTNNTQVTFSDGETITSDAAGAPTAVVNTTATGSAAFIAAGVYYINGFHVNVIAQTLLLDKYSNTPSYRVGLTVTESFVTSNDDVSLVDNAQGSSNQNAPGAHRFKIDLTLTKKTISSTEDSNFVELLRLSNGVLQNQVRTTEYSVLEDTFARRTFDESGDYTVRDFDLDLREHLIDGNNRGIYTSGNGGVESKIAAGLSPGKAYIKGYEIETIGTKFVDVNKAREFDTQNAFNTRFDVGNYVNVTNVYGSPDVGFVSGDVEAFKKVNLFNTATVTPGTQNEGSASSTNKIGRAKSRGFEYVTGTASTNIFSSSAVYKHYLFDINLFTHLNVTTNQTFAVAASTTTSGEQYVITSVGTSNFVSIGASSNTVGVIFTATGAGSGTGTVRPLGEYVTGSTSGATGTIELDTTSESVAISSVSVADPAVVTTGGHNFKEGQQVTISGATGLTLADSTVVSTQVFTVRNPDATTFELYNTDGTTSVEVIAYGSGGTATHGVTMLSNVKGNFIAGETITSSTTAQTAVIQSDAVGFSAVRSYDFPSVKHIGMAGTPTYTSDTKTDITYGDIFTLTGNVTVSSTSANVIGSGTKFLTELKTGDSISFDNTSGTTETKIVEAIISDTQLTLSSVIGGTAVSSAIATRNRAKLQDSNKNISIFKLPYTNIKTLKTTSNSGITDTSYTIRKHETKTLSSNGDTTITAGTNEIFVGLSQKDYSVSIMSTGAGGSGSVGDVLSLSGNNHEGDPIFTLSGSPLGKQLTLDFGVNFQGHKIKILTTVDKSTAGSKTKSLNSNITHIATDQNEIQRGTIRIPYADVYQINSIYMAPDFSTTPTTSHVNVTSRFNLDSGQRDNFYDVGRIVLKTGELTPTGQLLINFNYFSHSSGDYFDVDSYSGVVDYADIPTYTSDTTGTTYNLRDCLDFRPRVDNASTINSGTQDRSFDGAGASTVDVIQFNSNVTSDFEYYLPRIDKIFLDKEGNFKVVEGASSLNPQVPKELDGAMHLYTLEIPAYTLSTDDIIIKKVDNKRYTMRDIGKLENRIESLEYYTQLSLLETAAQNLQIQDAEGFDRFKNGFIVDNFTGHNVGDVGNIDYKAAMDMARGELRPTFNEDAIQLIERDDDGTPLIASDRTNANYQRTGDIVTLPYSEVTIIDQPYASKSINLNPFNVFTWSGNVDLNPPGDEWKETERAPELVINNVGGFDTLVSGLGNSALNGFEISTVWNEWQDFWTGAPRDVASRDVGPKLMEGRRIFTRTEVSTEQTVSQTRTGIRQRIVPQVVRNSIGDRIVNVAFVPFIRSRTVTFTATRLKPNTRVYPFFDNINVTSYVTPIEINPSTGVETTGSLGGAIIANTNGAVKGTFAIPDPKVDSNPRWRTGQRVFRLTSSSTNDTSADVTTAAEADYIARGLLETVQNTVISTREPRVVRESTTENRSIVRTSTRTSERTIGWVDPLAQTFLIDSVGGVFITSLDIFFASKDANIPVTLQIREVVNGYPGKTILPFSEVTLNPSSVNVSSNASTATTFTFNSPVYLQENVEYCFVLLANSNDYTAYVGRLGETNIGSDRTISQQPYAGVLFKSQNGSTWTAEQNEDIKFKMKRAEFSNVTGVLTLSNDTLPSRTLKNNPIRTTSGSNVIRVFHPNHGMHGTNNNVTISGCPLTGINGLDATEVNATHTSISNITLDSYDITLVTNATSSGDVGSNAVTATQNRIVDVLNLNVQTLTVPGTNITYSVRTTTGKSISGTETEFQLAGTSNSQSIIANDNIYFDSPKMIASGINESNEVGNKSLLVNISMTTTNTKLSPVIDLQRISAIVVQNRLNNPQSGDPDYVADTSSTGTSTAGVYVTRPISLQNASTALDVRLTSNVRSTSSVEVYYRVTGAEEVRTLDELSWIPFNGDGSEDLTVTPAEDDETFKEYKYTASDINDFTSFQIKIVMKGNNSSYPPIIKDMRGIALAV